jgi:phospholipid/cholesterol/gamma-HCH transport system permease protein
MVWLIVWGTPLVVLVHVGQGSFLALQAFHGAIFLDAVGPVVGVGLFRNVGSQLTGLVVCGLMSIHTVAELRLNRSKADRIARVADRDALRGLNAQESPFEPDPSRLAFARVFGAMLASPILGFIGCVAGLISGLSVSRSILDVPTIWFLYNFMEMLWARDLVGILVKGVAFGGAAGLIAAHEGLRRPEGATDDLGVSVWRSTCLGIAAILLLNAAWFTFMFLGGAPFGRTVLEPPVPR